MSKIRVFEAFAGVGSQSMALRNIGVDYEVVGICEVDRYGLLCYDAIHNNNEEVEEVSKEAMLEEINRANIGYNFSTGKSEIPKNIKDIKALYDAHIRSKNYGDICKIDASKLPDFDLFTYSYPCKNVSISGKQASLAKGSGTQSALLWECEKIIDAKLPPMLLMENVKNLVGPQHKPHFDEWCRLLELKGYNNYWHIYNASDYGLPQNRERVMMVSILKENDKGFKIPAKRPLELRIKDILLDDEEVDNKYYLPLEISRKFKYKHKEIKDDTKPLRLGGVYDKPSRVHQAGSVWHQDCVSPTLNAMLGGYKQPLIVVGEEDSKVKNEGIAINGDGVYVTYNGVRVELPCACASRGRNPENPSDRTVGAKTEQRLELNVKGVTNTLTTVQKDNYILDERTEVLSNEDSLLTKYYILRKLVPLECWRLMGYRDEDYYKCEAIGVSNTKLYERSGRGIAVWMLEDIFKEMFNALKGIDVTYKEDIDEGYSEVAVTSL